MRSGGQPGHSNVGDDRALGYVLPDARAFGEA